MLTKPALCTKQEGDRISAKIGSKEIGGTGTVWPVELCTPVGQTEKWSRTKGSHTNWLFLPIQKVKQFQKSCGHSWSHVKSQLFQKQQPFEDQQPLFPFWWKCQVVSRQWRDPKFICYELWLLPNNPKNKRITIATLRTAVMMLNSNTAAFGYFLVCAHKDTSSKNCHCNLENQASPNQTFFHGHNHFKKKLGLEIREFSRAGQEAQLVKI